MLLLDPFSHCDICLEPYTSDETPQTPHAIPCGHVFCKTCLLNVQPANCPLCRKPFMPDRIKRIHVERPDNSDIYRHAEYLKRLILTWGTSDEELALLLGDIEEWLSAKTDDGATALRKAIVILRKYQRIQTKKDDYHRMIRRLKDQIASGDSANASKTEEFRIQNTDFENQVQGLQRLVIRYETELGGLRPLIARVENYEHELKKLRQQLEYYAYPSNSFRDNPLPQPPIPASYESQRPSFTSKSRLSSSTSSYPKHTNDARDGNLYTNGYTVDPSSDSNNSKKNGKGKEREHGPSYSFSAPSSNYDSPADPTHASFANLSLASASDGVLPGASPRRRVVPTANSKPNLPDPEPKIEPKLVSGARPDLPVPQTPANHSSSPLSGGMLDPPAAGRDYPDVYAFGAAYVSEYAAGHRAGYQLAEYTPGQAARVVPSQNTGNMNAAGSPYGNGYAANGERRETGRGLANLNALSMALSDVLSTPSMESNEISRDGNSQVGVSDMASTTTAGDSASSASSDSRRTPRRHSLSYHSPAQTQQTQATGRLTDDATLSSFNTGITDGSTTLARNRSLRQQPTFRSDESHSALFSGLGFTVPATNHTGNNGNTGNSNRPRYLAHASVPPPSLGVGIITTVPATTPATADQAATTVTRDDRSGRSNISASSWGTINTNSASILSWQSTGSNMMNFQLRNFASHAGASSAPVDENWGPNIPPMMVNPTTTTITVNTTGGNERNGNDHARDDSGGFRVVRESDEERTPVSRFSRTLPAASNATTTNGGDGGERLQVASENRDRERNRERERSDRRRDRRRSQRASNTPSHTADAVRYAQVTENATEQSRDVIQYGAPASYPNQPSGLLFQPANSTPSHSQPQPQGQSQPQADDRRLRRRLSVATAPVESHHTSTAPTTTPVHAGSEWNADPGYYTDVPSASANHRLYAASQSRNNVPAESDAVGNNLITSPTLFNSNASTNALGLDGLDGLNEQQRRPLQISAPTPIVSSRSFLRSYSYDHF